MKCEIIKDLLPSYIEGITCQVTNEEIENHLKDCSTCKDTYEQMTGEIDKELPKADIEEVNYLKKIRNKNIKSIFIVSGSIIAVFLILSSFFAAGFPVSSKEMDMSYKLKDNNLEINLDLNNGHDLIHSSEIKFILDKNKNIIGTETRYKLAWIFNNPFDNVGSNFSIGTHIDNHSNQQYTNRIILEYEDKEVIFENGKLLKIDK